MSGRAVEDARGTKRRPAPAGDGCAGAWLSRGEGSLVLAILLLVVAANLATAHLYPVVWLDEVQLAEPAANLAAGRGLHSSAWAAQPESETWLAYMPLYPVLLAAWLRLFDVSVVAVRSFGMVLGALGIGAAWLASRRLGILEKPASRVSFVSIAACGAGMSFSYRCGRGDTVTFVLAALALLAVSDPVRWRRSAILLAIGALVPLSGLQGLAFVVLLSGILLPFVGRRVAEPALLLVTGSLLGLGAFFLLLERIGLWETFRRVIVAGRGLGGDVLGHAISRLTHFPGVAVEDPSAVLLVLLCLAGLAPLRPGLRERLPGPAAFGAVAAVWVPTLMCAAGRYALYYAWMAWIPLLLAALRLHERGAAPAVPRWAQRGTLGVAAFVGLPLQLALGLADGPARSPRLVEDLVAATVPSGAVVYCDPAAWYAARRIASRVLLTSYGRQLTDDDVSSIGAVVARVGPVPEYEAIDPRVERLWQPADGPPLPSSRVRFGRLHWIYGDYATLRAWTRRPAPSP